MHKLINAQVHKNDQIKNYKEHFTAKLATIKHSQIKMLLFYNRYLVGLNHDL